MNLSVVGRVDSEALSHAKQLQLPSYEASLPVVRVQTFDAGVKRGISDGWQ